MNKEEMRIKYDVRPQTNGDIELTCLDCGAEYTIPKADVEMIKKERIVIVCDACQDME